MNSKTKSSPKKRMTMVPPENEWSALFVMAEHWRSDLKFFADELDFLRNVMDKHFSTLVDEKHLDISRQIGARLTRLMKRRATLEQTVTKHLKHLGGLFENPFPHDAQTYRDEHGQMEADLANFLKDFKLTKKKLFRLMDQALEFDKGKHLLEHI